MRHDYVKYAQEKEEKKSKKKYEIKNQHFYYNSRLTFVVIHAITMTREKKIGKENNDIVIVKLYTLWLFCVMNFRFLIRK